MARLLQVEFARKGGVSKQAITKALRHGKLVRDPAGGIDPEHPVNTAWLALHREDFDSRGRDMATHSHAGRPLAAAAVGRGKAAASALGAPRRNAGSAAAQDADAQLRTGVHLDELHRDDEGGIDLAQLAAELRLDELSSGAALDNELRRLQVSGGALLDLDRLLGNVARTIADGFNREGEMLVAVLTGIDARLAALKQHGAGSDRAEVVTRLAALAEGLTGVPADIAELGRRLVPLEQRLPDGLAAGFAKMETLLSGQGETTRHRLDSVGEQIRRLIEVLARHAERR
jgi:hypothetical protein